MILHVLIAMVAGWMQRHQQHVIAYLQFECALRTVRSLDQKRESSYPFNADGPHQLADTQSTTIESSRNDNTDLCLFPSVRLSFDHNLHITVQCIEKP
jgi:hypothetical protein